MAGIVRSAHVEVGGDQGVSPHALEQVFVAFPAHPHHHHGVMGIGNDFLDDFVAPLGIGISQPDGRGTAVDVFESALQIALFFVDEGFSIGDEELGEAAPKTTLFARLSPAH